MRWTIGQIDGQSDGDMKSQGGSLDNVGVVSGVQLVWGSSRESWDSEGVQQCAWPVYIPDAQVDHEQASMLMEAIEISFSNIKKHFTKLIPKKLSKYKFSYNNLEIIS